MVICNEILGFFLNAVINDEDNVQMVYEFGYC